ncbi:MAG: hypothetical protein OXG79_12295 [Chloroflexi bacterium]|nr:hypothetical protein [Chloroflexota bacterium]
MSLTYVATCTGCGGLLAASVLVPDKPSRMVESAKFLLELETEPVDFDIIETEAVRTSSEWSHRPDCAYKPAEQLELVDTDAQS